MGSRAPYLLLLAAIVLTGSVVSAQVFVVGERTATDTISSEFRPTDVSLPTTRISQRGERELERMLVAEQGFAHMALPLGAGLTLEANGPLTPGGDKYRHLLFEKGESAAPGDRVVVTALQIHGDRLILDFNGGPFVKHRFLSHVQFNNNSVAPAQDQPTGARVTLVFPHGLPDISAPEIKALLAPVIDFGVKSSEQAYADTLPAPLRDAIAAHEVLVGMNKRMVLAALGQPDSKVREHTGGDSNAARYEEWIYGHVPEAVRFVRFSGDRVSQLEIAELGKPLQIHDQNEVGGFAPPPPTREVPMGDVVADATRSAPAAPSLRRPGEAAPAADSHSGASSSGRVQLPSIDTTTGSAKPDPTPSAPQFNFSAHSGFLQATPARQ